MKLWHWTRLVSDLRHGRCVLVLGPELEVENSGGPAESTDTRAMLARHLASQLQDVGYDAPTTDLAPVAQLYEDDRKFGSAALHSEAASFYSSLTLSPSPVHSALAALPFQLIITTCHDQLFTEALRRSSTPGKQPTLYRYHFRGDTRDNPELASTISVATPAVFHLFGDPEEPNSLVLSENDLLDFLISVASGRPPLPDSLRRRLARRGQSLLFVGFGVSHWYLRVLLKVLVRALDLPQSFSLEPWYSLTESERKQTVLFYQRGTQIEVLDTTLDSFVHELTTRLAAAGGFSTVADLPLHGIRIFISYASEDEELAARLFASLKNAGGEPWFDKDALTGGDRWEDIIKDQLRDTHFVLVVHSHALVNKVDSYVNKEISFARDRADEVRGRFLIPLVTDNKAFEEGVKELQEYQQIRLSASDYDATLRDIISLMRREYQLRQR
jgi:TIR domain/SIR2-like domain